MPHTKDDTQHEALALAKPKWVSPSVRRRQEEEAARLALAEPPIESASSDQVATPEGTEITATITNDIVADKLQVAKHLLPHVRKDLQRTLSEASTESGDSDSSDGLQRTLSEASTVSLHRVSSGSSFCSRVSFSEEAEVHFVEALPKEVIRGCEEEGTYWALYAERRTARFRIVKGGDSGLGELAKDIAIGAADIFSAWRCIAKIPATVPNHRLKQGLNWGPRRD